MQLILVGFIFLINFFAISAPMIFKKNMVVVLTHGRLAGKKAVVLKIIDEEYILVGGINRLPYKIEEYMSIQEKMKAEKFLTFIKKINIKHTIATRYIVEIDTNSIDLTIDIKNLIKKAELNKKINIEFKKLFENKKDHFLFNSIAITP